MSTLHRHSNLDAVLAIVSGLLLTCMQATAAEPTWWSFRPIGQPAVPLIKDRAWVRSPIDAFVLARLEKKGLTPAAPAERRILLRRLYFDLVGLPPSPEAVERFVHDPRPDAYERLVDRLLASPQYGERWARHWLDVVRYADSGGFEADHFYPSAWKYRDYVIRSFNANKPFDRFIREQVAGDELWPGNHEAAVATGLYCVGPVLEESAMRSTELEYEWLTDAADTTGATFLGLTFGCARCHDHKYDPLTQRDYYGMQGIFAASDRAFPQKVRLQRIKGLNGLLSETPVPKSLLSDPRCTVQTDEQVGFGLFHRRQPLTIRRLRRGELSKPKEKVGPALPAALIRQDEHNAFRGVPAGKRRARLAQWLTAADNPLTARVLVNRVWGWHFGQGIVRTPNDFGAQGEPPTHPELLDWLAHDLQTHGWDLKRLHRLIVLSNTYRKSSIARGRGLEMDPPDRLLWHFPRHRLEGEAIRDGMLACSGQLNLKPFGRPVVPPLSAEELTGLFDARHKWKVTRNPQEHGRRSVYLLVRRTFVYPLFAAFDSPELMTSCPRRLQTTVPTQALTLLNSPLADQQALAFARRLRHECHDQPQQEIGRAWLLAFGRQATAAERDHALALLHRTQTGNRDSALAELCLALFNANEFITLD